MSYHVDLQNDHQFPIDAAALERAALAVLDAHGVEYNTTLSVVLLPDEDIRALNQQHRGVDAATDVLSFPADDLPQDIDEAPYLGDVLIGFPYVQAQSEREGFPLAESLILMVVHGMLHLLGYDHDTPDNRADMWDVQSVLLEQLGVRPEIVLAYEQEHDE